MGFITPLNKGLAAGSQGILESLGRGFDADGRGDDIPANPGITPANAPVVPYTLSAKIDGDVLKFFYMNPGNGYKPTDDPLDMRVTQDCVIQLNLDPAIRWRFKQGGTPITLGTPSNAGAPPARNRYLDVTDPVPANCQTISFYAKFLPRPAAAFENKDSFSIAVEIDQVKDDGTPADPLYLLIDPGIKNPGDGL